MHLITRDKVIPRAEVSRALERELRTGLLLKKALEEQREIKARQAAKLLRDHRPIKGLGRCVSVMPSWEWFRNRQKYGVQEMHSKGFLNYFQKKFPELAPHKL